MDVVFGDILLRPRMLIVESDPKWKYTAISESGGIHYLHEYCARTRDEWIAWIETFSDDLTGRQLREAKEAVMAPFTEPQEWLGFRTRYSETGDPWIRTP